MCTIYSAKAQKNPSSFQETKSVLRKREDSVSPWASTPCLQGPIPGCVSLRSEVPPWVPNLSLLNFLDSVLKPEAVSWNQPSCLAKLSCRPSGRSRPALLASLTSRSPSLPAHLCLVELAKHQPCQSLTTTSKPSQSSHDSGSETQVASVSGGT